MPYSLSELAELCEMRPTPASLQAMAMGFALPLLAEQPGRPVESLSWHVDRLAAGLCTKQVALTFDRFGQLCGFVQWARVSPDIGAGLLKRGTDGLAAKDMLSGSQTWILELHAMHGALAHILSNLRDHWLSASDSVTYFRNKPGRRIAKRVSRADGSSFFARPPCTSDDLRKFLKTIKGETFLLHASKALDAALELGEVARLASQLPSVGGIPLPQAIFRIRTPGRLSQRKLYRDGSGALSGFLSWAWVEEPLLSNPPAPQQLAEHQWNQGCNLLVQDAFTTLEGFASMAADLEHGLIPGEKPSLRAEYMDGSTGPAFSLAAQDAGNLCHPVAAHRQPLDALRYLSAARGRGVR